MPFHLDSPWDATFSAFAMDWDGILTAGKKLRSYFKRVLDQVHEILGRCRGPNVLFNALARLFPSCFIQKMFEI